VGRALDVIELIGGVKHGCYPVGDKHVFKERR
jgi:hypothetical protein